jgi:RNA polymerase sigma factor (sigma-70 family)
MGEIAAEPPRVRTPVVGLSTLGDDRIASLVAAGDQRAFAVLYKRHHQALFRYCNSMLGDREDAADALQNTMAAALRGLAGETREIRLKPWLFRIAHNECATMLRRRRPQVALDDALELAAPESSDAATHERLRQLVADLGDLSDAQRGALVMRELSGLGYEEIAAALGVTVAGARQTVFEARITLHQLVEGRAMECDGVRQALSDNDGRTLRGRRLRAHLKGCAACRDFRALIGTRRRDLAALAPPLPAAAAAGLMHHVIGGGTATVSAGGSAGGAGIGSIVAGKAVVASTALKATAALVAAAAVGAGTVGAVRVIEHPSSASPGRRAAQPAPVTHRVTLSPPASRSAPGLVPAPASSSPGSQLAQTGSNGRGRAFGRSQAPGQGTRTRIHAVGPPVGVGQGKAPAATKHTTHKPATHTPPGHAAPKQTHAHGRPKRVGHQVDTTPVPAPTVPDTGPGKSDEHHGAASTQGNSR